MSIGGDIHRLLRHDQLVQARGRQTLDRNAPRVFYSKELSQDVIDTICFPSFLVIIKSSV